jgi:Cys-tRNA(Pro) deacylase
VPEKPEAAPVRPDAASLFFVPSRPALNGGAGEAFMAKDKVPVTPAIRQLRAAGVTFTDHVYAYEEKGGTAVSARELGVEEHCVVKTLIMEDEAKRPLVVLMHGDRQVSTKELARVMGVKSVSPCSPDTANRHSGYQVGGTSPFGTRHAMPVYMEESILGLPKIYINGGKRGYLIGLDPREARRLLNPVIVRVAI